MEMGLEMESFSVSMIDCFSKELKSGKTSEIWTQKSFFILMMHFLSVSSNLTFFSVSSVSVSSATEAGMVECTKRILVLETTGLRVSPVEILKSLRFDLNEGLTL